jgi:ComF family protein
MDVNNKSKDETLQYFATQALVWIIQDNFYYDTTNRPKLEQMFFKRWPGIKTYYENLSAAVAEQMRKPLIAEMRATGLMPKDCLITFLPRSHKNKAKDGFDQSFRLAKALSLATGIKFVNCFDRKIKTDEQKNLNLYERQLNMNSAYKPRNVENEVEGKTVILVDDIVTTGSSMAACARIAYSMGAYAVMGICLGYTEKINKK